jgi:hypothetical protein
VSCSQDSTRGHTHLQHFVQNVRRRIRWLVVMAVPSAYIVCSYFHMFVYALYVHVHTEMGIINVFHAAPAARLRCAGTTGNRRVRY